MIWFCGKYNISKNKLFIQISILCENFDILAPVLMQIFKLSNDLWIGKHERFLKYSKWMNFLWIKLVCCWVLRIHSAFQNLFNRKTPYNSKEVKYKNRLDIFNNFGSNRKPIKIEHKPHTLCSFHYIIFLLFGKMCYMANIGETYFI